MTPRVPSPRSRGEDRPQAVAERGPGYVLADDGAAGAAQAAPVTASQDPIVISLRGVSKSYPAWTGRPRTLRDVLARRVPLSHRRGEQRLAVRDISLGLRGGEAVGLIGGNGAGKSTLLRIAAGLTQPTTGTVRTPPGTAAVLTLGEAFALDLTGSENAITAAVVSGFTPRQARELLPAILEYAELEDAALAPVRTYSEGMKLRLAFAVVAQLRPTALILDEVMSVGDLSFQRKSHARIRQARDEGAAVLLATHDLDMLVEDCDRVLWLKHGRVHRFGAPDELVAEYRNEMLDESMRRTPAPLASEEDGEAPEQIGRIGSREVEIGDVVLHTEHGSGQRVTLRTGDPLRASWKVRADGTPPRPPIIVFSIDDSRGNCVSSLTTERDGIPLTLDSAEQEFSISLDRVDLAPGRYTVQIGAYRDDWSYAYDMHHEGYEIEVLGIVDPSGVMDPPHSWSIQ